MSQGGLTNQNNPAKILILMGSLWLILSASLFYFQQIRPPSIKVEWTTETELNTAGFNLYRSGSQDGDFERINEELIPSKGDSLSGASYAFTDHDVETSETYYYLLEEIEIDATANRYEADIFSHTVPTTTWWVLVLTAVSALAGLFLIVIGFQERKS